MFVFFDIINTFCKSEVKFVQVGGNDGVLADPINRFIKTRNWKGIIAEPIPEYFEKLTENYKDNNSVKLVNVAIDENNQGKTMYKATEKRIQRQIQEENTNHKKTHSSNSLQDHAVSWSEYSTLVPVVN